MHGLQANTRGFAWAKGQRSPRWQGLYAAKASQSSGIRAAPGRAQGRSSAVPSSAGLPALALPQRHSHTCSARCSRRKWRRSCSGEEAGNVLAPAAHPVHSTAGQGNKPQLQCTVQTSVDGRCWARQSMPTQNPDHPGPTHMARQARRRRYSAAQLRQSDPRRVVCQVLQQGTLVLQEADSTTGGCHAAVRKLQEQSAPAPHKFIHIRCRRREEVVRLCCANPSTWHAYAGGEAQRHMAVQAG